MSAQKYVISESKKDIPKLNAWFKYCEECDLPYIFIEKIWRFWKVEYDLIALGDKYRDFQLNDDVKRKISDIFRRYLKPYDDYLRKYGKRKNIYKLFYQDAKIIQSLNIGRFGVHAGNIFGYLKGLTTKEEATKLAEELYDVLYEYIIDFLKNLSTVKEPCVG